jgi:hypothetical protein
MRAVLCLKAIDALEAHTVELDDVPTGLWPGPRPLSCTVELA